MSARSKVYAAIADGGNELREALVARFPNLTFILDRIMTTSVLSVYPKVAGEVESAIALHSPEAATDSRGYLASRYS